MSAVRSYPTFKLGPFTAIVKLISFGASGDSHHCGYLSAPETLFTGVSVYDLSPHGGITFDETENGVRTIGFDCAHCDDSRTPGDPNWRDYFYVENELRELAHQLLAQLNHPNELKS